jgi:hypothetical protein
LVKLHESILSATSDRQRKTILQQLSPQENQSYDLYKQFVYNTGKFKWLMGLDLGERFAVAGAQLDMQAVLDLNNPHRHEVIRSFLISNKSLQYPRKQQTAGYQLRKNASDADIITEAEQLLSTFATDRRGVTPPADVPLVDLINGAVELADEVCRRLRSYDSWQFIAKGKSLFKKLFNRLMDIAVEFIIRCAGVEYTDAQLAARRQQGRHYYERALPADDSPGVIALGVANFSTTRAGSMTSTHTELQRRLVRRVEGLNKERRARGALPIVILGVDEYCTTKCCPRCQEPCDFYITKRGDALGRIKRCYR